MVDQIGFESAAYHNGETQRFSFNGEGLTILAFFPGAFTGVCTEEMCNFRDSMSEFNEMDAEVIGISVDTPFALEEFADRAEQLRREASKQPRKCLTHLEKSLHQFFSLEQLFYLGRDRHSTQYLSLRL